ncbi:MAG: hypothetical protein RBT47_07435 [Anaerolineae bacterium]|nr:hypothetical protein [Anaerolineae bacterium]
MGMFPPPGFVPGKSTVEGIEVFVPAPVEVEARKPVMDFKCPNCGATTAYSAADGGLRCEHCGYYEAPKREIVGKGAEEFEFKVETLALAAQGWGQSRRELQCQNCGAATSLPDTALAYTCPFCGSNKVIQREASQDVLRPRFLVPFRVTIENCLVAARQWLGSSWMVPVDLQRLAALAGFTSIYIPFWTFDAVATAGWKAEVGHTESERYYDDGEWKTRTRTVWRWESGNVRLTFDDVLTAGTARISHVLLPQIQEYDLQQLVPYEPSYLAGHHAQAYDIPLEPAWETARQQMREETRTACHDQASTSQTRNFSMSLDFSAESWRYILLPVYLTVYKYQDKAYQVIINGQTGAVGGQRPVDWTKVWLVLAAILAPGLLLSLAGLVTFFTGIGVVVAIVGFVLLIVGLIVDVVLFNTAQELDKA